MAQDSNFEKASCFYSLIERRPITEKTLIVQILEETTNVRAASIIRETQQSSSSESSSELESLPESESSASPESEPFFVNT